MGLGDQFFTISEIGIFPAQIRARASITCQSWASTLRPLSMPRILQKKPFWPLKLYENCWVAGALPRPRWRSL